MVPTAVCFCVELVKLLLMHRYSVDIFSYYGPSGILGSDVKQNTAKARVVRIVALSISSYEQSKTTSLLFSNIAGSFYFLRILFLRLIWYISHMRKTLL